MKVEIIEPSGCCFGVNSAINTVIKIKKENPTTPIYILGMLVHNETVIDQINKLGIITLKGNIEDEIKALNDGIVIFTAHGHDKKLDDIAKSRHLKVVDTTCAFVKYNHHLVTQAINENHQVIFIGKKNHPEANATLAIDANVFLFDNHEPFDYTLIKDKFPRIVCQTTISMSEAKEIFNTIQKHIPQAVFLKSICHATIQRQEALNHLNHKTDLILIVGSFTSNNTRKLFELAKKIYPKKKIIQIQSKADLLSQNLDNYQYVSIIGGASTPKTILEDIKDYLNKR